MARKVYLKTQNTVDWTGYSLIERPDYKEVGIPTPQASRQYLQRYLLQDRLRLENVQELLARNNIVFQDDRKSISLVNRFFVDNLNLGSNEIQVDIRWNYFTWDFSLFLGNYIVDICAPFRKLKWDVKDVSIKKLDIYSRPKMIVTGFSDSVYDFAPDQILHDVIDRVMTTRPKNWTAGGLFFHPYDYFQQAIDRALIGSKS